MEAIRSLTVTLETVTPLFLGGANPRGEPELRAPSFRGALRYWLRAALGGVIGDQDIDSLRQLESTVFGSTKSGSPICIRLKLLGDRLHCQREKILPHKENREAGSRQAIEAGQRFKLTLSMHYPFNPEVWAAAIASLRLALTFGGVGLRSRRGYGTLKVVHSTDLYQLPPSPTSLQGWRRYIKETTENAIKVCRHLAQAQKISVRTEPPHGPTRFPCANKKSLILISNLSASSAMEAVIRFMQQVPRDAAFGGINPRQASPLWVRPIQTENGYGLLFLVLASNLKTDTDYKKVREFLDQHFRGDYLQAKGWNS